MSTLAERLALALGRIEGAKQADLARACKVKSASVSNWFTGETKTLKADTLQKAAAFLRVRTQWLMTGEGPMDAAGGEWPFGHLVDVAHVRRLSSSSQSEIVGFMKALIARELGAQALADMEAGPLAEPQSFTAAREYYGPGGVLSGKRAAGGNT